MEQTGQNGKEHCVSLKNRCGLTVTGVTDVGSYIDSAITVILADGELYIEGEALQILKLSLECGELSVGGRISALVWRDGQKNGERDGFLKRLMK